jgi:hypothetical protein
MQIRLKAKLGIGGPTLDPDVVERQVGVKPIRRYRLGEQTRGGLTRDAGGCLWETELESTKNTDALVQRLLETLRPLERLRQLADESDGWVFVEVVSYVNGDVSPHDAGDFAFQSPAYELSSKSVADLAALGASYGVDQYIDLDRRPEDERPDDERTDSWAWGG